MKFVLFFLCLFDMTFFVRFFVRFLFFVQIAIYLVETRGHTRGETTLGRPSSIENLTVKILALLSILISSKMIFGSDAISFDLNQRLGSGTFGQVFVVSNHRVNHRHMLDMLL